MPRRCMHIPVNVWIRIPRRNHTMTAAQLDTSERDDTHDWGKRKKPKRKAECDRKEFTFLAHETRLIGIVNVYFE